MTPVQQWCKVGRIAYPARVTELVLMRSAYEPLDALYDSDPATAERIEDIFDALSKDPRGQRFRRRSLSPPARFLYVVHGSGTSPDWAFLWFLDETGDNAEVVIDWLGVNLFG